MAGVTNRPDDAARTTEILRTVWNRSRENVLERVTTVDRALAAAQAGMLDDAMREEARGAAHMLAGSAGTFGFMRGTELARELERELSGPSAPSAEVLPRLCEQAAALRAELDREPAS
jgi:HPt (histidine-containing phosphotransfer) domain-containing protein